MSLGVNDHHQTQVVNYMRFARYQRGQRLRSVDGCFSDTKDSQLCDDTYTLDEVTELLDGLLDLVRSEVESELINTMHTNILLLRQVFQQAEKWHLKLQADISELENRELLEKIKDFEDAEFSGAKSGFSPAKSSRLEPLNEGGGAGLLHMKIEELESENAELRERIKELDGQTSTLHNNKTRLEQDLEKTATERDKLKGRKPDESGEEVEKIRKEMAGLQSEYNQKHSTQQETEGIMQSDLADTKHELLRIQEMLEMAEKELERKVSLTTPFKNIKQMLQKKNDQMKTLRKRLSKYETVTDD